MERNAIFARSNHVSQRTFSIIKPDAVRKGYTGAILAEIEKAGFQIVSIKKQSISKGRPRAFTRSQRASVLRFELTTFMSSGPIVLLVLEKGKRHRRSAQADGRDQSGERGRGHDPQEVCRFD
jgi:nucleoside diphosphate kinase